MLGLVVTDMAGQRVSFWPLDGEAFWEDHHQHGAGVHRVHHGGFYGEEAGATRHDSRLFDFEARVTVRELQ